MTTLALPGRNGRLPVTWSMTAQYSPSGCTRGAVLLVLVGGVLIVTTWFSIRYFPWRCLTRVLYRYVFGTLWVFADF